MYVSNFLFILKCAIFKNKNFFMINVILLIVFKMVLISGSDQFAPLKNKRFLMACYGEDVDRIPVWIMRQAGRYLPEFQEIRKKHDFFTICETPELAAKVTLMPIERFDLDAAIIFSDILVIPKALGMVVKMIDKVGPVIENPLQKATDFDKFYNLDMNEIIQKLEHVGDAITLTRTKLNGRVPLIGFSGGPWTLLAYMIEGGGSKTLSKAKKWLYCDSTATQKALGYLSNVIIEYLKMQIEHGAQALQLFESSAEYLTSQHFREFLVPNLQYIFEKLQKFIVDGNYKVPLILFAKGCYHSLAEQEKLPINVISLDWTANIKEARTKSNKTLQGNLDPPALYANTEVLTKTVNEMLNAFSNNYGRKKYIANLGHGIYPDTPIESVKSFIKLVHNY